MLFLFCSYPPVELRSPRPALITRAHYRSYSVISQAINIVCAKRAAALTYMHMRMKPANLSVRLSHASVQPELTVRQPLKRGQQVTKPGPPRHANRNRRPPLVSPVKRQPRLVVQLVPHTHAAAANLNTKVTVQMIKCRTLGQPKAKQQLVCTAHGLRRQLHNNRHK